MSAKFISVMIIDPYAHEVRSQWIRQSELSDIYAAIGVGCTNFTVAYANGLKECMYIDGEGLFNDQHAGFSVPGHPLLMGRAIVIGTDNQGNSTMCETDARDIQKLVTWLSEDQVCKMLESLG